MNSTDRPARAFQHALGNGGVWLDIATWRFHVRSSVPLIGAGLELLYRDYPVSFDDPGFADFHVQVVRPIGVRRWLRPQVLFEFGDDRPFQPFPYAQALPMLEWGMNWCLSSSIAHMLIVHAAVLERDGRAIVMPAPPGHGKSTLTAALVVHGWRLLSDEFALVDVDGGVLRPFPRPVSLKNRSIEVIRGFAPDAVLSDVVHDTVKGDIAYMRPPAASVQRATEPARPGWVVFPRYVAGAPTCFDAVPKAEAFRSIAEQSFNYHILGRRGFEAAAALIDASECRRFEYHQLDEAIAAFDALTAPGHG